MSMDFLKWKYSETAWLAVNQVLLMLVLLEFFETGVLKLQLYRQQLIQFFEEQYSTATAGAFQTVSRLALSPRNHLETNRFLVAIHLYAGFLQDNSTNNKEYGGFLK